MWEFGEEKGDTPNHVRLEAGRQLSSSGKKINIAA
jgi:hypothetical protein